MPGYQRPCETNGWSLVIVGAGGHGRVCADIATASGWLTLGFCDCQTTTGSLLNGVPVVASGLQTLVLDSPPEKTALFIAIGDNTARARLFGEALNFGYEVVTLVHPSAVVSPFAAIGAGTVLMPGTIVNANATVGKYCIVNTAATIDHDALIEDGAQLCPGVHIAGGAVVGREAFVGTAAALVPKVKVGSGSTIGAGSVVLQDVPNGARVAGVPARLMEPRFPMRPQT